MSKKQRLFTPKSEQPLILDKKMKMYSWLIGTSL